MSVCPCCGYCPHCGHRNNQPYQPYYPYQWQYQPSCIGNSGTYTDVQPYGQPYVGSGSGYATSGAYPSAETTTFGQISHSGACCASTPAGVQ